MNSFAEQMGNIVADLAASAAARASYLADLRRHGLIEGRNVAGRRHVVIGEAGSNNHDDRTEGNGNDWNRSAATCPQPQGIM